MVDHKLYQCLSACLEVLPHLATTSPTLSPPGPVSRICPETPGYTCPCWRKTQFAFTLFPGTLRYVIQEDSVGIPLSSILYYIGLPICEPI